MVAYNIIGDAITLSSHNYDTKVKFICSRIKKKAEAKGENCHAKTMWSLEKPI